MHQNFQIQAASTAVNDVIKESVYFIMVCCSSSQFILKPAPHLEGKMFLHLLHHLMYCFLYYHHWHQQSQSPQNKKLGR